MSHSRRLESLLGFPLVNALFGRRARRFGLGMEIPTGPLAFKSQKDPVPLTELEQTILVAAATGVSGWSFGVPFGPRTPASHAEFTLRFTGRTGPTAAGAGRETRTVRSLKYGKFPGIRSTIMLPGFVQAHHLDLDFYDRYYADGAYLPAHAAHTRVWHE